MNGRSQKHLAYRPDIDGLRALAVIGVVIYHYSPTLLPGGLTGVDVFFVISGYLISGLILRNIASGTFSFAEFYQRRVRRIFPALILVVLSVWVAGWFALLPPDYAALGTDVAAAAGFVSNFMFWHEAGYFDTAAELKPLLHLWSLGVEEQFYIVWPTILILLSRTKRPMTLVLIAAGLASFGWSLYETFTDPTAAFYSPATRFWELLLGSVLAYLQESSARRGVSALRLTPMSAGLAGCLGVGLIVAGMLLIDDRSPFPGYWALLPTVGTFLVIAAGPTSWINARFLQLRPVVFVGLISYPLYLWHWPLLSFARIVEGQQPSLSLRLILVVASVGLAWLTYVFLERPIRFGAPSRVKIYALSAAMAAIGCIGVTTIALDGFDYRLPDDIRNLAATPGPDVKKDWRRDSCFLELSETRANFRPSCIESKRPLLFLWGDSVAAALYPGFRGAQRRYSFGMGELTTAGCPPIVSYVSPVRPDCKDNNDFALSLIAKYKPDIVVLHAAWAGYNDKDFNLDNLKITIDDLRKLGVPRIVIIGPPLEWIEPGLPKLFAQYFKEHERLLPSYTTEYLYRYAARIDANLRRKAAAWGVQYISVWNSMCTVDGCPTRAGPSGRVPFAWDPLHLTIDGSKMLIDKIMPALLDGRSSSRSGFSLFEHNPSGSDKPWHQENNVVASLSKILPEDPARARVSDGVSFAGITYTPIEIDAKLHIEVSANAWAKEPNDLVVAVFRAGTATPIHLESKPIPAGTSVTVAFVFEIAAKKFATLNFRIGPGHAGTIVFNGPPGARSDKHSAVTISEEGLPSHVPAGR